MDYKALIFVLIISGCVQTDGDHHNTYATVSGRIVNKVNDFNITSFKGSVSHKLRVDGEGTIQDTLYLEDGVYTLTDNTSNMDIYIARGTDLGINGDAKNLYSTVAFSGPSEHINNYLASKERLRDDLWGSKVESYKLSEEDFKTKMRNIEGGLLRLLNSKWQVPKGFKEREKRNLHYEFLFELTEYAALHGHYSRIENYEPSGNFLRELGSIPHDNEEDYRFSDYYAKLIYGHYKKKALDLIINGAGEWGLADIEMFGEIENEYIRNALLYKCGLDMIGNTVVPEKFYNAFMALSTNEAHREKITERYLELSNIASGLPAPKFFDYENYDGGTTSLDDFKGRYVYIDVWATWCSSCIAIMPDLKKVEQTYGDKNIAFVGISIDKPSDYKKWRDMVKGKRLGGVQLLANDGDASKLIDDYFISGIPRFILIDPNGNLIESRAPGPNRMELIELFNSLNI